MAHNTEDEHDMYVAQLKEVFDSCDDSGAGKLTKAELEKLCLKLQLEDQTEALVKQMIGENQEKRVTFDEFKEGFVAVLSEAVDGISSDEETEYDTDLGTTGGTVSPKFFRGKRRYGRRTLPDSSEGEGTLSLKFGRRTLPDSSEGEGTMGTADFSEYSSRTRSSRGHTSSRVSSFDVEEENIGAYDDVDGPRQPQANPVQNLQQKDTNNIPETFEAEGEVNQNIADMENALDPVSEEEHLKEIWRELGVGKSGYLTIHELATVCEHIGMDEMNQEELEHLFAKLDTDGDGNVSFQEFLQGLFQHGGPMTPSPPQLSRLSPNRPLSTPRLKNKLAASFDAQDRQTPSFGSHGSGLFSEIDPDNSGYATGEAVIELWQSLGIPQGAEILEFLQFDVHSKINLTELSYALEQELRSVEDDNATFQVAVATYEHEFTYQRSNSEHLTAERDKLRSDLAEANNRITLLVKEADERNAALEKAKEKELLTLESKYEDQIRNLHSDMDQERETLIQQTNKQRIKLEQEIESFKEEEAKLKDKVVFHQKELDKMEEEMFEVMEQCSELERHNLKLQKELQGTDELRGKLEELESQRANILDEQEKFSSQKLLQLEQENKELKDKTDELTMEVEELAQQISSNRKQRKVPRQHNVSPINMASPKYRESASENSDDDVLSPTSRRRRFLPQQPSISDDGSEGRNTNSNGAIIQELERGFSIERKDIEDAFKMEIAQLEDNHIREKNDLAKQFKQERDLLESEFAQKLEASLIEKECNLYEVFNQEKHDLSIIHESENNMLEHNFAQEKADLVRRMREEFDSELEHKLDEQRQEYMKELEQTVTRDSSTDEDYKKQVSELQLQLKLQEEELNLKFRQQVAKLQQEFETEKAKLDERNRLQILDHDNIFSKGVDGLEGKLKTDFETLLEQYKVMVAEDERNKQIQALAGEKDAIIEEFTRQQEHIVRKLKKERKESEQKNKAEIQQLKHTLDKERDAWHKERKQVQLQMQMERDALQSEVDQNISSDRHIEVQKLKDVLEQDRRNLDLERQSLHAQFEAGVQRERDQLERERASLRQLMEEEVSRELHAQMEDEFLEQMDRVKIAFREEQAQLENRVQMLQEELDDINRTRDMEERFRQQMESQTKDVEIKNRKQLEDLRTNNEKLRKENEKLEKELCEKAAKHEPIVLATQIPKSHTSTDALRDKLILEAISQQSRLLVDRTSEIQHTLKSIHREPPHVLMLKQDNERLIEEKKVLQEQMGELNNQLQTAQETNMYAEQYKTQLQKWEVERSSLQEQLEITTDKLATINMSMSLKDSEHLRAIQRLNDKLSQTVAVTKYNNLNAQLIESEKKARELGVALEERAAETNKLIQGLRKDHERAMQHLQKEKEAIENKLQMTRQLLDTQVKKLKQQLEHASRLDILVKELYVENSNLMKCLELSERRGVKAERDVHGLEEKCRVMNRVLKKVGTSALV